MPHFKIIVPIVVEAESQEEAEDQVRRYFRNLGMETIPDPDAIVDAEFTEVIKGDDAH